MSKKPTASTITFNKSFKISITLTESDIERWLDSCNDRKTLKHLAEHAKAKAKELKHDH